MRAHSTCGCSERTCSYSFRTPSCFRRRQTRKTRRPRSPRWARASRTRSVDDARAGEQKLSHILFSSAQVRNFIMHRCPDLASADPTVGRLSFFGHSAGSIVVRAALASPLLRLFSPKLFAFVSLSSSHLGNMYMNSALIAGGMWAIKKLRKARSRPPPVSPPPPPWHRVEHGSWVAL